MMGFIVCCRCEELTDHWVVWGASPIEEVYYCCSNVCLAAWLVCHPDVEWPVILPLDPPE